MIMKRKIWLDPERFALCEVESFEKVDIYHNLTRIDIESIKEAMINNGYCVERIVCDPIDDAVVVDKLSFFFMGERYDLNQCSDILEWVGDSQVYDFTRYYDKIVFHHPDGRFYAAYIEDTSNYFKI